MGPAQQCSPVCLASSSHHCWRHDLLLVRLFNPVFLSVPAIISDPSKQHHSLRYPPSSGQLLAYKAAVKAMLAAHCCTCCPVLTPTCVKRIRPTTNLYGSKCTCFLNECLAHSFSHAWTVVITPLSGERWGGRGGVVLMVPDDVHRRQPGSVRHCGRPAWNSFALSAITICASQESPLQRYTHACEQAPHNSSSTLFTWSE